jgi:hypothetical protein
LCARVNSADSSLGQGGGGPRRPAAFPGLEATILQQSPAVSLKQPSIDFSEDFGGEDVVVASHGQSPTRHGGGEEDYYGGSDAQLPDYGDDVYDLPADKVKYK